MTIIFGLISRKISYLPLCTGDMLWGIMIFFIIKFINPDKPDRLVALISLALCYLVEFSQLYQAPWIITIRRTLPGRLVLGQGFLWSDLLAYTAGIAAVWGAFMILKKRRN